MSAPQRIALGTVQLGLPYGVSNSAGKPPREEAFRILEEALSLGVRTWDTARAYGESEEIIGDFLRERAPQEPVRVLTKIPALRGKGGNEAISLYEESTRLLGRGPDAVLFHDESDLLGGSGASLFQSIRDRCETVGVSVYDPESVAPLLRRLPLRLLQAPANLLDPRFLSPPLLGLLQEKGVELHVRSVFLQGLFFLEPEALPERLAFARETLADLHALSQKHGMTLPELALSWTLSQPGIAALVLGVNSAQELRETLSWARELDRNTLDSLSPELGRIRSAMDRRTALPALWPSPPTP